MADDEPTDIVTVFLRNAGDVLLLRRSDEVGSYAGRWGGVAGHSEGDPDGAAHEEVREETGIDPATLELARRGDPFEFEDDEYAWRVHPYLFDCPTREVEPNYETAEYEWVPPTEILRRETVPELWTSYDRVRPTPGTVATDTEYGSASLSLRALECLRDEAALAVERGGDWGGLVSVARDLLDARPSMAVVANRVNRAMHRASEGGERDATKGSAPKRRTGSESGTRPEGVSRNSERGAERPASHATREPRTPVAVERVASEAHREAREADAAAATPDPDWKRVLTLSRSGTVEEVLLDAPNLGEVFVAESRPDREGVGVAERLAGEIRVTLHTDAAVAHVLATREVDAVVVGADAVLADGSVVNKTGTRAAALSAAREGVPLCVVCAADKVTPDEEATLESGPRESVYDGDADVGVLNPTFDVTPPDLVSAVRTELGVLDTDDVREVAREHAALADWDAR
jgi:translation initiation factor 2B subunit (eIF-2B alpha/beta/delta family)/ADP-ribose pyrophosphatase YjhB (NUDIX family)